MKNAKSVQALDTRLQEVFNRLDNERVVCYDSETSGLDWRSQHIVGYVLAFSGNPRDSYYLPVRHLGDGNIGGKSGPTDKNGWDGKTEPWEDKLLQKLDQQGSLVFGHHLNFDLKFTWRAGMRRLVSRFEDTLINAPLLDEFQAKYSLEFCCEQAGVAAKKGDEIKAYIRQQFPQETWTRDNNEMGHFWRLRGDDAMATEYACGDGTSTWQLRDWQMQQIEAQDLGLVHDIESRLIPILARMSCRGIKIDLERLDWLKTEIQGRLQRLYEGLPSDFNVRSPGDVQKWCVDHGQLDWPFTPGRLVKGVRVPAPSFPESWLETHEAGKQIIAVRKLETLNSTFVQPMATEHLWNGRVHTSFNQLKTDEFGTVTGRLSSSAPNLQAVPKHNEMIGRLFRSIFVPDDGMIWRSDDYAQVEPVLLAFYSRCKVLIDGYRADPPVDAHSAATRAITPNWQSLSDKEFKKIRNDTGKRVNQTLVTGGGKGVLVKKYKVDPKEVDRIWNEYFRAMPEIRVLQKQSSARFRRRGYVLSLLGRRARLRHANLDYTATNRLLQCGNADILKLKMVEMDEYLASEGRPVDLLNNVHDSIDFQFLEENRKYYEECSRIMQDFSEGQVIELDVPLRVDGDEGPNWAIASYGPERI